ncbi:hypothetical protein [Haloarcula litorea]|uniref:hypothetical protein n=1 Tax=Haloarcula litorea TaxID=3032579 RepID=UPI0023E869EA|nr:hypothetical protein [Halomicroarcula sp. GDY20]
MQRRAAAAYFAFFLVISAAAYAYIGVAESQRPEVQLEATAELENESTFTVDGVTYTASNVGTGGDSPVADLSWTNESARYTATLEDNSTTTLENTTYRISTNNTTNTVTLRQEFNVTRLLQQDSAVENSLAQQNGTQYVVYRENDTLRPLAEWLPEPETRTYPISSVYPYQTDGGVQQTTLVSVGDASATVEWTAPRDRTVELSEGGNVTLQGQQFFAHFPANDTVEIVSVDHYDTYLEQRDRIDYFQERVNGLWGVSILSGIAAVLLLGMAYLPTRG